MFLDWWTPIENLPALLKGALVSLELTLTVFALSLFFGTIVGFLRYNKHHKAGYRIATVYVELIRNTPMLVQIFFLYFGLPQFKIYLPALFAGILGLTINNTAYIAEIVRSGIMAIDIGQFEAGRSLGFGYAATMWHIILPQALKNVLPALGNEIIVLLKETSISGYIALTDLTHGGNVIRSQTYSAFMPLLAVALVYLAIVSLLAAGVSALERRLRTNER